MAFTANGTTVDVARLAARLADIKAGEQITYADIRTIIGTNPQIGKGRSVLDRARKVALRDHDCVFRCINNTGLRRLPDGEITKRVPREMRQSIRRKAVRASKEIVAVDYAALPPDARTDHNVALSMAGALIQATAEPTRKRLESKCKQTDERLSLEETLAMFRK